MIGDPDETQFLLSPLCVSNPTSTTLLMSGLTININTVVHPFPSLSSGTFVSVSTSQSEIWCIIRTCYKYMTPENWKRRTSRRNSRFFSASFICLLIHPPTGRFSIWTIDFFSFSHCTKNMIFLCLPFLGF